MHALPNKRKWIWVGRRGGKGRGVLFEALGAINEASITPSLVTNEIAAELGLIEGADITNTLTPQIHVWTVAPNYGQAQQVWNEMKEVIPASMVRTNSGKRGNRSQTGWNEDRMSVRLDLPALDERGRRLPADWDGHASKGYHQYRKRTGSAGIFTMRRIIRGQTT